MLKHILPEIVPALKGYGKRGLLKDISAGLIVGIVALPLAIALSIASGLGPKEGIITSVAAGFFAAVAGGSRQQISGVTGAFSVVVSGLLLSHGLSGLFAATFIAGVILILMGLFKVGALVRFIPSSVVAGFTLGIAFIIFLSQIKDFLGLTATIPAGNLDKISAIAAGISTVNWRSVIIGITALIVIIAVEKINRKLPSMFIALIVCSLLNIFTAAPALGDFYGTANLTLSVDISFIKGLDLLAILPPAITIALLSAISALLSAVVADDITGSKHNPHSELIGQGLSNIMSPIFGGSPSTGAVARTSENARAGAVSPISAIVHCAVMALWGFAFMGLAAYIPMAAFAAVLFVVCKNMSDFKRLFYILRVSPTDALMLLSAFVLTVFVNIIFAILITSAISAVINIIKNFAPKKKLTISAQQGVTTISGNLNYLNINKIGTDNIDTLDITNITGMDCGAMLFLSKRLKGGKIQHIVCSNKKLLKKISHDKEFTSHNIL